MTDKERKIKVGGKERKGFVFALGDRVKDRVSGFEGIVFHRSEWLTNCNTYGVKPTKLDKEGKPCDSVVFDEPMLELVSKNTHSGISPEHKTGGPVEVFSETNR